VTFLSGYKTYLIGTLTIAIGVIRIATGETKEGVDLILGGLGMMTLRAGISKDSNDSKGCI